MVLSHPEYPEREYYTDRIKWYNDRIDVHNSMIEELEQWYERTPLTRQHDRDRLLNGVNQVKRDLANIQPEYDKFKEKEAQHALR